MRQWTAVLVVAVIVSSVLAQDLSTVDREYAALSSRARDLVERFLRTDCELGELGDEMKSVVELGDSLKAYLNAVRQEGPPSPVLLQLERDLEQAWAARVAFLQRPEAKALGEDALKRLRSVTSEQYRADARTALLAKYRERSSLALGLIEGKANDQQP